MTALEPRETPGGLDEVVRAVDGVTTLFSAVPVIEREARRLLDRGDAPAALVDARERDGRLEVTASIGVDGEAQAPAVARAVAEALRARLGDAARITVRVSRVGEPL